MNRSLAVLAGAPAVVLAISSGALAAQEGWRTLTTSRQRAGNDAVSAHVRYGAGQIRIRPTDAGPLYRMELRYFEEAFEPVEAYDAGRIDLGLESRNRRSFIGREWTEGEMNLELARGVPMTLDLELGAVKADLDLGGLSLTELQIETGASQTRLDVSEPNPIAMESVELDVGAADFVATRLGNLNATEIDASAGLGRLRLELTGEWRQDATLEIEMGLGSLELVVPEGLGLRLTRETFLTSFDPEGLVKRGDVYYSTDWETAERRVSVAVDAAFGAINVSWTEP